MTPEVAELIGALGSGGGLAVLGFLAAKVSPLIRRWMKLMEAQEKLANAQLAALGENPAEVAQVRLQVAKDVSEIKQAVTA